MDKIENAKYKKIENTANETLKNIDYNDETDIVDVIKIAKKLGFLVGNAGLDDSIDGFIIIKEGTDEILGQKTDKLIGVNASRELETKRFIIAHEIGHYKLHYNRENGMYAHRENKKGKGEKENDVDYFAATLLMPKERFINRFNELKEKKLSKEELITLMSDKFCVTKDAVSRRFKELHLDV